MCVCVCPCFGCVRVFVIAVHSCTFTGAQMQVNTLKNMAEHTNKPTTITMNNTDMHTRCLNTECIYKHIRTAS